MTTQEQRIADALIERIRQRRDTIDPELAQRIHQGLSNAPDAFYLLVQVAVAQGIQIESLQAQNMTPQTQNSWQGQAPPPPPQQPGFLEKIFGSGPSAPVQNYAPASGYAAQQQAYSQQAPASSGPGQPLGTSGYQAVNANLPGANQNSAPQYPQQSYGAPYGQPQQYPQQTYGQPGYGSQPYPQQSYGVPSQQSGYPAQAYYPQPGYGQPNVIPGGYPPAGQPGYPPPSGYPGGPGWGQPGASMGGSMLNGVGGLVAGAAAGALVTGAVESAIHGYENHERREEEVAREEHHGRDDSWRSDHDRGLADTNQSDDSDFYKPGRDASSSDSADTSNFADTGDNNDSGDDDNGGSDNSDDASDFGGFSSDDNN